MWERVFENEINVETSSCLVSSTISPFGPKSYPEDMAELLFETFDIAGLYFSVPSVLSLYAKGKTTGIVLDSGECITSCIPVIDGFIVQSAVQTLPFGGRDITDYIGRQLGVTHGGGEEGAGASMATREIIRQMKEDLCSCGPPKGDSGEKQSYTLPDGKVRLPACLQLAPRQAAPLYLPVVAAPLCSLCCAAAAAFAACTYWAPRVCSCWRPRTSPAVSSKSSSLIP